MAVAFDAVGPSSAGTGVETSTTLSWSHTVSGTNTVLLVGVAVGDDNNPAITSVTCGSTAMTEVGGQILPNAQEGVGYLQVYELSGVAAGANTITVTMATSTDLLTAGSLSFNGVGGIGSPYTSSGAGSTASIVASSTTSGNIIAAFMANGSGTESATSPATSRFICNGDTYTAAGNCAGATSPATGSSVTVSWAIENDWWGVLAVEMQAASSAPRNTGGLFPVVAW